MILSTGLLPKDLRDRVVEEALISTSCVLAINALRDFYNKILNLFGGELKSYSSLLEKVTETTLHRLATKAKHEGWSGVHSIIIAAPPVTEGAAEVMVLGTAFRF